MCSTFCCAYKKRVILLIENTHLWPLHILTSTFYFFNTYSGHNLRDGVPVSVKTYVIFLYPRDFLDWELYLSREIILRRRIIIARHTITKIKSEYPYSLYSNHLVIAILHFGSGQKTKTYDCTIYLHVNLNIKKELVCI